MTSQDELLIRGTYNTLYNAITHPDRKFVVTHYFLDEWVPVLGPSLAWLVVALRQRCFWNKRSDWCIIDKAALARDAAMKERTIERSLKKPFSRWFILDITHRYRYRTDLGKKVRDKNRYHLLLDEPLSPRHQLGLAHLLSQILPATDDPIEAALSILPTLLDMPHLTDKISYQGKIDKKLPRRTILELVAEAIGIELIEYADDERLALLDHYCSQLHNHIVQPNKVYVGWQYFRLNWVEPLGHSLAWLIIYLRRRCFWNEASGELRESCTLFKKDLARAIGQTPRNLANLMDNPYIPLFFTHPTSATPGGREDGRKGPANFRVRLVDEPLVPEDQRHVAEELSRRLQGQFYEADFEHGQLNLFPIIDQASNRQNFAYGHAAEEMSARETKKSRLDNEERDDISTYEAKKSRVDGNSKENLSGRSQKKRRADEPKAENLSGRYGQRKFDEQEQTEILSGREVGKKESEGKAEILPDRWQKSGRFNHGEEENLSGSKLKKGRLDDLKPEKMSQHDLAETRKNVVTLKDSLTLLETKKIQQQETDAAAVENLLDDLNIQGPIRNRLLSDPEVKPTQIKAWLLYAKTQSGLNYPKRYVIKRLLDGDAPPIDFLAFANLDDKTWDLFEQVAQALYFGQPVAVDLPPDLQEIFIKWAHVYRRLDPKEVRLLLSQSQAQQQDRPFDQFVDLDDFDEIVDQELEWADQIWQSALSLLKLKMAKSTFDTWLRQTSGVAYDEEVLVIRVQNNYAKDWLENRLNGLIERALADVVGKPLMVRFIVPDQREKHAS